MNLEIVKEEPVADAHATPILFVHGMFHAAWCWSEHFLPFFAHYGYRSYALSLRGHGTSEGRERLLWTSLADFVSDVAQAVRQMDKPPVLVGHSMGGMLVQKYLETEEAPAAVLMASGPPRGILRIGLRSFLRRPLVTLKANLTLNLTHLVSTPRLVQEAFFSADMPAEQVKVYCSRLQEESYRALIDMCAPNLPRPERIKTPVLVLGAANDTALSVGDVESTARAYDTQAEVFPDMAHNMMLEADWQSVAERIVNWLQQKGL